MIDKPTWDRLDASTVALSGNRPVLIDRDTTVRFIQSGSVGLYAVPVKEGRVAGTRRLLGRIGSGQALLSVHLQKMEGMRFAFVPTGPSVIRLAPLEELWDAMVEQGVALDGLVDEWAGLVAGWMARPPRKDASTRASGDGQLSLDEGEVLASERGRVLWVAVEEGRLELHGDAGQALAPGDGFLPLAEGLRARAAAPTRVTTRSSGSMGSAQELEQGLRRMHAIVLESLDRQRQAAAEEEVVRLRRRRDEQQQRKREAMRELAAVLEPEAVSRQPSRDQALMGALARVGEDLGVPIRWPGRSEDLERVADPVEAIARASRLRTRRVVLAEGWWTRDGGPLLCWSGDKEGRPLALISSRSGYLVFDPVDGTQRKLDGPGAADLGAEAVAIYPPLPERRLELKEFLIHALRRRGDDIRQALSAGLLAALLGLLVPITMGLLMDQAIPDGDRRLLIELGIGLLAATLGRVLFLLLQGLFLMRIHAAWEAETQAALWDRLLNLRPSFFRRFSSGDLQSRVMVLDTIGNQLSGSTIASLVAGVMAMLNLGLLFYYSASLAFMALALGLVVATFTLTVSTAIRRNARDLLEVQGELFGLEIQLINGVGKLRVAGAATRAFNHWAAHYGRQLRLWARNFVLRDRVLLFNVMVAPLSSLLLFAFALPLLSSGGAGGGGLTLGSFLAFSVAYGMFLGGITSLTTTAVNILDILVKGRRIEPILEEEPEVSSVKADPGRLTGKLAANDVRFRYKDDGPEILQGVSVRAEPGEFVAVVGPSGSGKSTLLRLLLGFETPSGGSVTYDDQDLAEVDAVAVRRQLGVVLQGGTLDGGTIFENIACGSAATLDEAWAAAKDAGMAADIEEMPMGMHTIISAGGGNLSGGQRQRLLITRSLVQRPKILLFDEATSALDNRTQAIVSESLERLNVTRIVIAHRLSTIRNADRIYVIDAGVVVQEGRFDDLMEAPDGLFGRMMRRQMV